MRTVEQVVSDYVKAQHTVKQAEIVRDKYKSELKEIYDAVAIHFDRDEVL